MRKTLIFAAAIAAAFFSMAQTDWRQYERLMEAGSYKSAYAEAERVYASRAGSRDRLAAAVRMTEAAAHYQEDVRDSAVSCIRRLLPDLDSLHSSIAYAMLGSYDTALADETLLRATPVEQVKEFCELHSTGKRSSEQLNVTPTAWEMLIVQMQDRGRLTVQQRVDWQRRLIAGLPSDASDDLRIWHDLRLLEFMDAVPNHHVGPDQYWHYIAKYRGTKSKWLASFYARVAHLYNNRSEYLAAVACCDTAVALAPSSEGGADAARLRADIWAVRIEMADEGLTVAPNAPSLQRVRVRNVKGLWYRIVPWFEEFRYGEKAKSRMVAAKAVAEGKWEVNSGDEHRYVEFMVPLPELKAGRWLLLVSPSKDLKSEGFMAYELSCTDMLVLQQSGSEGILVDRRTGRPIAGQEMRLMRRTNGQPSKELLKATAVTDLDGRYSFDFKDNTWNTYIEIERDGFKQTLLYGRRQAAVDTSMQLRVELRTDRPIYKPGDTAHVAAVCYRTDGVEAMVEPACNLSVILHDPNGKVVEKTEASTDEYGIASVVFALPTDRLPGEYGVEVVCNKRNLAWTSLRVEEYKQPKFMVTMETVADGGRGFAFGTPCTVRGTAVAYSGVPVSGAQVRYTVVRRHLANRWWWHWDVFSETEVASGELTTASDGSFVVEFDPEPDSSVELSSKPTFEYVVRTDVTDINGESHPASTSMRVGYTTAFLSIADVAERRTLEGLEVSYVDINGNALPQDSVHMRIEPLRQPDCPLLDAPVMNASSRQVLDEQEFRRQFPYYAYSAAYNDAAQWPVGKGTGAGVYRITVTAPGADTLVEHCVLTPEGVKKTSSQKLLWADIDRTTVEVGNTVTVRLGTRFSGIEVYWLLRVGSEVRQFRRIILDNEMRSITIPVDSTMLGGFVAEAFAVKEGVQMHHVWNVQVPFLHKRLDVDISTFRDHLLPGETEQWTIKVKEGPAALVMAMYDDALNSYVGGTSWNFSPWRKHWSETLSPIRIYSATGWWLKEHEFIGYDVQTPTVWSLRDPIPRYSHRFYATARGESGMVTMSGNVRKSAAVVNAMVMDDAVEEVALESAKVTDEEMDAVAAANTQEPQLRTNLNTLAFFACDVRTDSNGTATYQFTVPDLLTRWSVKGLAVSKDIKIGTIDRSLVTSKPLMVQPNMPRFLRHGDSLSLMAKVVMSEPTDPVDVTVTLLLTDAATGDTICNHTEQVTVRDVAQVLFDVEVPQNVYVATYRIVATADGGVLAERRYSDGEQGQVPVVSNRQAVTVSQAMYINGVGEKHYTLSEWQAGGDTRQPQLVAAEAVSNPVWLAIKAMPYMKTMENPSTLYLANQLYVNGLGAKVLEDLDVLDNLELLDNLGSAPSRLAMNEDVKQTALQATPWLRDAESEEEQMRAVKNYFDTAAMQAQHDELVEGLAERQNGDGGWPWMPEGKSSLWVTQQVLQKVCGTELNPTKRTPKHQAPDTKRALAFVDGEQQRYYERYVKPYAKKYNWQPTDIDYLYMRSLYGKASTEAYKFYYSNALKNYKQYGNLYTQAQLALVFHRHGDKKEALDLLRRLKEKSLVNDEMGLYWRDNRSGWYWYSRPIETQALLVQAFAEITPQDTTTIGLMQQWLLKQKQTTHWGNERATAEAIKALMVGKKTAGRANPAGQNVRLTVLGDSALASATHHSAANPEGYISHRWTGSDLDALAARRSSDITFEKTTPGIAWGAVYYQFIDDMDKIPASDMGIKISRNYVTEGELHVGDRIKVRIEITADRAMDYLELVDGRPSCTEPLSTRAGWRWNDGLSYYVTVNNTDTRFYIEHIDKGHYVAEYELYVTNPGTFLSGAATMQCMYATEFRAVAPAVRLTVE